MRKKSVHVKGHFARRTRKGCAYTSRWIPAHNRKKAKKHR